MTSLSNEILKNYQIRKTSKQKDAFINLIKTNFLEIQIQQGGLLSSRNLILGDLEKSEFVLTAHYDTCARLPFPNFITPKNPLFYLLYNIAVLIPIFILMFLFSMLIQHLTDNFWINYFLTLAMYFGFCALLLVGPPNKNNANDNTSGVIVLCELYSRLSPEEKEKVTFVFFDNEESGLLGSRLFKKKYNKIMKDKLLINFDCVSDGDYILLAATKSAREKWSIEKYFSTENNKTPLHEKAEKTLYPSDQQGFPNSIAIAALKKRKIIGYYMNRIHTAKDTVFDCKNIEYLCHNIISLINNR